MTYAFSRVARIADELPLDDRIALLYVEVAQIASRLTTYHDRKFSDDDIRDALTQYVNARRASE